MGLAPLNDELCMIAHIVMAGPISRLESVLGLLAGSLGRNEASRFASIARPQPSQSR